MAIGITRFGHGTRPDLLHLFNRRALVVRKLGLKILGSPFPGWTTSYMGMNLLPDVSRRQALESLIRWAFEDLGCVHLEIMDRHLSIGDVRELGLEYRSLSSFEIDLTQHEEPLCANMLETPTPLEFTVEGGGTEFLRAIAYGMMILN